MQYISTRGNIRHQTSAEVISQGMVPQGGLFVPEKLPRVKWQDYEKFSYKEIALKLMKLFFKELPSEALQEAVDVYEDGRFDTHNPAPLVQVGECGILELWHGPTAAFKDMALQVLPYLLTASTKKLGMNSDVLILTATSGDTGKAALEGFKDVKGTKIVVFYPDGGVSAVQERQMITAGGSNTYVTAVKGNFDECQTAVKNVFASSDLRQKLETHNMVFSSANSINWGRLLPQIVYYFWAYLQAVRQQRMESGEPFNIVVPTGNFGNILAAYYAKMMGLPIAQLICASNQNNVLADFFRTGIYDSRRPFYLTSSPSMDILISSNFERFLFEMSGRNHQQIRTWFKELNTTGSFQVDDQTLKACQENMYAGWATEETVTKTISQVYDNDRYVLDPHTAVAMKVYWDYRQRTKDNTYTVITSTASPFKFAESVLRALNKNALKATDPWQALNNLSELTGWNIPVGLKNLQAKETQNVHHCSPDEIKAYLMEQFSLT